MQVLSSSYGTVTQKPEVKQCSSTVGKNRGGTDGEWNYQICFIELNTGLAGSGAERVAGEQEKKESGGTESRTKRKILFSKQLVYVQGFGDEQSPYTESVDFIDKLVGVHHWESPTGQCQLEAKAKSKLSVFLI